MGRRAGIAGPGSFPGFAAGSLATAVPNAFFSQLLTRIETIEELLVSLYFFFLLKRARRPQMVRESELLAEAPLLRALANLSPLPPGEALKKGLAEASGRGTLLLLQVASASGEPAYSLNIAGNRKGISALKAGGEVRDMPVPEAAFEPLPNIFELYEQNIGLLTPMVAEELQIAEESYPTDWIEAAFREAAVLNKRSWRYVKAILDRWKAEGATDEKVGRNSQSDQHERRYFTGKRRSPYGE